MVCPTPIGERRHLHPNPGSVFDLCACTHYACGSALPHRLRIRGAIACGMNLRLEKGAVQKQTGKSRVWLPLLAFFVALAFICGVTVSGLGVVSLAPDATAQTAQTEAPTTRRCPECGWIESNRDMPGGADNLAIRIQEYTVRMVDGSIRIFNGGPGDRWRVGESLTFIDGDRRPGR